MLQKLLFPFVVGLSVCLLLCHCETIGSEGLSDFGKYLDLEKGESTKTDIYDLFGQPSDVLYEGEIGESPSTWYYMHADRWGAWWGYIPYVGLAAGGTRENYTVAVFDFDGDEKLKSLHSEQDSSFTHYLVGITRDPYRFMTDPKAERVEAELTRLNKPFDKKFARKIAERRFE